MNVTYNGNTLFNKNFGLYGYDDIEFNESKDAILKAFKSQFEKPLKNALETIGLKYIEMVYYSPKYYNFENDTIDLIIELSDLNLLKKAILEHKEDINKTLKLNKSYDGYISLTINSVNTELERLENKENYEPDILVLRTIINKLLSFEDFEVFDYLVYDIEIFEEVL